MSEFRVHVDVSGGVGRLRWESQTVAVEVLQRAISLASDDAIIGQDLRRIQVDLLATDLPADAALGVTSEPEGGSKQPTTTPLLTVPLA